ncbi:unnamed protein product, partial [Rotaria socialis]
QFLIQNQTSKFVIAIAMKQQLQNQA